MRQRLVCNSTGMYGYRTMVVQECDSAAHGFAGKWGYSMQSRYMVMQCGSKGLKQCSSSVLFVAAQVCVSTVCGSTCEIAVWWRRDPQSSFLAILQFHTCCHKLCNVGSGEMGMKKNYCY